LSQTALGDNDTFTIVHITAKSDSDPDVPPKLSINPVLPFPEQATDSCAHQTSFRPNHTVTSF